MIRVILFGTFLVTIALNLLLLVSFFALHNLQVSNRLVIGACVLLYVIISAFLLTRGRSHVVAWMLISLYSFIAFIVLASWGINTPIGILILGLIIVLSGVMLGAKVILPVSFTLLILLITVQILTTSNLIEADRLWLIRDSNFGDVISYSTILGVFALLAWLSRRQMENTLHKALNAELALEVERNSLAIKVKEVTKSLKEAQLKEMQQLYRFAELGQLTAVILHDLANHLSVLTLDIEDLKGHGKQTTSIANAKESIDYIEKIVKEVRTKLSENSYSGRFDIIHLIEANVLELSKKSSRSGINILFNNKSNQSSHFMKGDPMKLAQSLTVLINNAIDACVLKQGENSHLYINILLNMKNENIYIIVQDNGIGISSKKRTQLFVPHKSDKKNGLGIGLYITHQIIETHFHGNLSIGPRKDITEFIIKLKS